MRSLPKASALLLAVPLLAGCGRTQGAAADGEGSGGGPGGRAIPVKAAAVEAQDVTYRIRALGSLEAEEMVQVTAEVDGALSEIRFHEGDRVTPETVLALIDPERYRLEAERAEANYRKALADESRAKQDLQRREDLARDQLVAAEELNRTRQEAERLAAETASVKAARDIALQNQQRSRVRARRAGVINARQADPGQFVRAGTVLATLVDTSRLRLRFKISEAESLRAKEGQDLSFRVAATGDRDFAGTIYHVGEVADPATRQVEVLAWVKNPGDLKPGFFAEVDLPTGTRKEVLVVPETAIQASERGFVAFVVEEGKARVREVQIGLRTGGGGVEILSGLKPGEQVIVQGSDRLDDGVAVLAQDGDSGSASAKPTAASAEAGER